MQTPLTRQREETCVELLLVEESRIWQSDPCSQKTAPQIHQWAASAPPAGSGQTWTSPSHHGYQISERKYLTHTNTLVTSATEHVHEQ